MLIGIINVKEHMNESKEDGVAFKSTNNVTAQLLDGSAM